MNANFLPAVHALRPLPFPRGLLRNPALGLWAGNALAWLGVLGMVLFHLGGLLAGARGALPEVRPLTPQPLILPTALPAALPTALPTAANRNPFDASGAAWQVGKAAHAAGELRGVIILPGVRAALTSGGAVHVGEPLAEGRLAEIHGSRVMIGSGDKQRSVQRTIDLPSARRPQLPSLNQATVQPAAPSTHPRRTTP